MRNKDPRLKAELVPEVAREANALVKAEYPQTKLGARACTVLGLADGAAAEEFILSRDPTNYGRYELVHYFGNLEHPNSPRKVERLHELEQRGGELGRWANKALGGMGMLSDAQIREIADRFRSEPTAEQLGRVFHVYLRFVIGKPVQRVVQVLGEPTKREQHGPLRRLVYRSADQKAVAVIFFRGETVSDVSDREPEAWPG